MANLVIKPASGSTNKLIFQNQAGNVDALTVDDSGAIAIAGNTTLAGTANALGTVTSGSVPHSLLTGPRHLQFQYGFEPSGVNTTSSSTNDTMTGAPETASTAVFDTGTATNTVWQLSAYIGINNEMGGTNWNASIALWVSYNGGTDWSRADGAGTFSHGSTGDYMIYTDHGDEYTYINGSTFNTTITTGKSNTKFGAAFFTAEGDNTRFNINDGMGAWITANQYQM